ncbi:unnamed protein product [Ceutorhynchus assimilis]|uniref:Major facilitator superfamily (MFS) profile domain-containing protein n=1 Tax=Ceutorhynchus assimilis TaxID=467358 RepID=A0A9N9QN55_9CUCU|nr:unnamed protein product [Ceutorhynchus assimilis]
MTDDGINALEEILEKIGKWGKFQVFYYLCLGFVVIYSVFTMNYIFVARDIKYRCYIPECDPESPKDAKYNPEFLKNFVTFKEGFPDRCSTYNISQTNLSSVPEMCTQNNYSFIGNRESHKCSNYVFERPERTIVHEFEIFCGENLWMLTMVGSANVAGELVSLSYTGFLSDKYGRKTIMALSVLLSSISGITKSFSVNYYMFLTFEFMDTALGGAMYGAAFVLAMELVTAEDRNIGNTAISCVYALGQVILGVIAWMTPDWRTMIRILYFPGLLSILIWIFLPESIRWLLSKNKLQQAGDALRNIAKINDKVLSREDLESLKKMFKVNGISLEETEAQKAENEGSVASFWSVLKNPVLLVRTIHCSMTWICCTFVFYGLTINSVNISENIHLSFIFAAMAETPGYVIYYYANERSGRRKLMFYSLVLGGAFCLAVGFLPDGWLKLITFFCGKCSLTIAYTVLYVFTTELFPTSSRHAMFSICSMFGRMGSMVAPQVPLLARISKRLPLFLFSCMSFTFGFLALFFPETAHIALPHTIEDALNISKRKTRNNKTEETSLENTF